jgi:signal transduction histidine kinase
VRDAFARFLVTGFVVLLIVTLPLILWVRSQTETHALYNARQITQRLADNAIAPLVTDELVNGEEAALERLRNRLAPWMHVGGIVRVKVWDMDGRILYSDVPSLISRRFELPMAELASDGDWQGVSVLEKQDDLVHEFEQASGELVEVYVRTVLKDNVPIMVEAYYDDAVVREEQKVVLANMAPPFLLGVLVLQLAQLIPALRLVKRIQGHQSSRRRLLQQAIDSSDLERRRLARDLHDDVIQDLAGLSYALEAEYMHGDADRAPIIGQARTILRKNVSALRDITTELYPTDLDELGLPAALDRFADSLRDGGVEVTLDVDRSTDVEHEHVAILYRVAREVIVNILKHAQARTARVVLSHDDGRTVLEIHDDGRGFDDTAGSPEGHLGLRIIRDTVRESGGTLEVSSGLGVGTSVVVAFGPDSGAHR